MTRTRIKVTVTEYGERDLNKDDPSYGQPYEDTVELTPSEFERLLHFLNDSLRERRNQPNHRTKMRIPQFAAYRNQYDADMEILVKLDI
jgi:hypothetical protein